MKGRLIPPCSRCRQNTPPAGETVCRRCRADEEARDHAREAVDKFYTNLAEIKDEKVVACLAALLYLVQHRHFD